MKQAIAIAGIVITIFAFPAPGQGTTHAKTKAVVVIR